MSSKSFYKSIISFSAILIIAGVFSLPIQPALAAQKVIAIDPGHGSVKDSRSDEGAIELSEAFKLKALLEKDGYKVVMTRTKNGQSYGVTGSGIDAQHAELAKRAGIANNAGADLVVSIHSDAHKRDQFSIIYSDTANVKDRLGHVIQRDAAYLGDCKKIGEVFYNAMKSGGFVANSDRPLHGEANNNTSRAETIGMPLALTAHLKAPNITVEVFGHESEANMQKYAKQETQTKVAQALESAVNSYFSVTSKQTSQDSSPNNSSAKNTSSGNNSTLAAGASPNCPVQALKSGPSEGEDYQMQIAHQINLINNTRNDALAKAEGGADKKSEKILVDTAMKYAPEADGKTRYKYHLGSHGPKIFDCSGFVSWVLAEAKKAGANLLTSEFRLSGGYAGVGTLIHRIDISKFTDSQGRSILRKAADMPDLNLLRPGDLLFFGTSTQCSDSTHKKCPNIIGHIGIYIGDGKYINSTSSDQDLSKDSASNDNPNIVPPITAHSQGEKYDDYNGVKVFDLQNSYFTAFYIEARRIIPASASTMGTVEGLGSTTLPAGPNVRPNLNSVHGLSAGHRANKPGHSTYQYSHPGAADGDALDFSTTYGYAVFDGTASHHDAGRDSYTVVTSTNGRVKAYYYHTFNLKDGPVTAGEKIVRTGQAGIDHVHFEMKVDGKPVNGNPAYKGDDFHYVRSLYINMKKVLGLI